MPVSHIPQETSGLEAAHRSGSRAQACAGHGLQSTCLDIELVIQRVRQGVESQSLAALQALLHQAPPHGQHQQDAAHVMRPAAVLPTLLDQGNAQHDDQREEAGAHSPGVEAQGPCRGRAAQCSLVLAGKVRLFAGKLMCRERRPQGWAQVTLRTWQCSIIGCWSDLPSCQRLDSTEHRGTVCQIRGAGDRAE